MCSNERLTNNHPAPHSVQVSSLLLFVREEIERRIGLRGESSHFASTPLLCFHSIPFFSNSPPIKYLATLICKAHQGQSMASYANLKGVHFKQRVRRCLIEEWSQGTRTFRPAEYCRPDGLNRVSDHATMITQVGLYHNLTRNALQIRGPCCEHSRKNLMAKDPRHNAVLSNNNKIIGISIIT